MHDLSGDARLLRALPVQTIQVEDGVVLKRGCTEILVQGAGATDTVNAVLNAANEHPVTRKAIADSFPTDERQAVLSLIDQLVAKRILVGHDSPFLEAAGAENHLSLFHWHFGQTAAQYAARLAACTFAIIGKNSLSFHLWERLRQEGATEVVIVDVPELRNPIDLTGTGNGELKTDDKTTLSPSDWENFRTHTDITCMIACSDSGGQHLLREWNVFCVRNNINFLPVFLKDMVGYIGPFVVPRESACLECLWMRQDAAMDDPTLRRQVEQRQALQSVATSVHKAMVSTLADFAAFEIIKFHNGLPNTHVGELIELRLLVPCLETRKILMAPRCPVCSGKRLNPTTSVYRTLAVPEYSNQKQETSAHE